MARHPLLDIRGWKTWAKQMFYLSEDSRFRIKLGPGFNVLFERQPEPLRNVKLMFFTGLFDGERRKIYEGDILKDPKGQLWEIVFDGGRFDAVGVNHGHRKALHLLFPSRNGWLVAGNIYADPELLKE